MQFQSSHIRITGESRSVPVIATSATLLELAQTFACCLCPFVLAKNEDGALIGVVFLTDFQNAIRSGVEDSATGWHSRLVSSILSVVLNEPSRGQPVSQNTHQDLECVSVTESGQLVAVLTNDDVLFSWNRLEPTLARVAVDELTSLPNRAHFERRLAEEWERAARQKLSVGVIIIDIDHFKQINDQYGHLQGDLVLRAVAQCCQRQLRSYDVVARFAGDEFIAVTSGCSGHDFETPIQRLHQAVRDLRLTVKDEEIAPSLSIGAALVSNGHDRLEPTQLIEAADQCLYIAKRRGRDRAFRTELAANGSISRPIEVGSVTAIEPDYQPQFISD